MGMTESRGVPSGFQSFTGDSDSERLRLESMARDGIEPRIGVLQTRALLPGSSGAVIVVRMPRSARSDFNEHAVLAND